MSNRQILILPKDAFSSDIADLISEETGYLVIFGLPSIEPKLLGYELRRCEVGGNGVPFTAIFHKLFDDYAYVEKDDGTLISVDLNFQTIKFTDR